MKYMIDSDGPINSRCAVEVNGKCVIDIQTAISIAENMDDCADSVVVNGEKFAVIHVYSNRIERHIQRVKGKATGIDKDFFLK